MASSRARACVKSHVRGVFISGSVNLRGLGASNQSCGRGSSALFSTSITAAARPPVAAVLLPPPQQKQRQQHHPHRGRWLATSRNNREGGGIRSCSSTPIAMATAPAPAEPAVAPPSLRSATAVCSWRPFATTARAHRPHPPHRHHHRRQQQQFCTSSGGASSGKLGDIKVTHVDAAAAGGGGVDDDDDDGREMMPEEDRLPIGAAGSAAQARSGGGGGGEPDTVRFLDVPGSEQTREEKMTIVFTCTVCETRTAKTFAKLSYEKGVVLARCPGCHNLHLIADRLGWFEEAGDAAGGWDIQKITNRIGESDCHVVNEDNVMELNLVDLVGKTTKQKEASPPQGTAEESSGSSGTS